MSASTSDLVASDLDLPAKENGNGARKPPTFWKMTMNEKLEHIKNVITVEPVIGLYVFAATICGPALNNLEFEKSCKANLNISDAVCDAILVASDENFTYTDELNKMQVHLGKRFFSRAWKQKKNGCAGNRTG